MNRGGYAVNASQLSSYSLKRPVAKERMVCFAALLIWLLIHEVGYSQGSFQGKVVVEWLVEHGPDRKMQLQEPISFTDEDGTVWEVPKGWIVDGASIPGIFWTTIGPPFVGDYRRASVIHDYYCDAKTRPWKDVHRMFKSACVAGGVSEAKARAMYAAVYVGGPRWEVIRKRITGGGGLSPFSVTEVETVFSFSPTPDEAKFVAAADWIVDESLSLDELDKRLAEESVFSLEELEKATERQIGGDDNLR